MGKQGEHTGDSGGRLRGGLTSVAPFGIWTQHVWIFWANTTNTALPDAVPWSSLYLVVSLAMVLGGIALGCCPQTQRDRFARYLGWASAILGCAGSVVIAFATAEGWGAGAVAGMALGGIGFSGLYLWWGNFYQRIGLRRAILYLFGAGIVSALAKTALIILPALPMAVFCCIIPLLSALFCNRALSMPLETAPTSVLFEPRDVAALWKVVLIFAIFSIANGSMLALQAPHRVFDTLPLFLGERACELALCALVLVYVFALKRSFDFVQLWRIVMFLLATGFLIDILVPASSVQPFFVAVSLNFIVLFVWLTLADIAHHSSIPAPLVFGIGWCCYTLPIFAGSLLALGAPLLGDSYKYATVLLYIVALTSAFCLETRDRSMKLIFHDLSSEPRPAPQDFESIDERCRTVAAQHHLTARELEVMQMLCRGRSKAYIAETLFITENTVKGHARRLYAKLNVHSKKELQQLIDAY